MEVFSVVNNFFILLSSLELICVCFSHVPLSQSLSGASFPVKILSYAPQCSEWLFNTSTLIFLIFFVFFF